MKDKIIVALDGMQHSDMFSLVRRLQGMVWGYKVNDALIAYGAEVIERLKMFGNVMADPKLYDIPNTVANGVKILANAGADIVTVHASAGVGVLRAAKEAAGKCQIAAVTVLTSDASPSRDVDVMNRVSLAVTAGLDAVVCAADDLDKIQFYKIKTIVPGIRPQGKVKGDDQVHVSSGIPASATWVVVGRPITQAEDPVKAVEELL